MKSICYLSATPIPETYLDEMDDFSDLTHYFKLEWDESVLEHPNLNTIAYNKKDSILKICSGIISKYRELGYFNTKKVTGERIYQSGVSMLVEQKSADGQSGVERILSQWYRIHISQET